MEQRGLRKRMRLGGWLAAGLLGCSLLVAGCSGDDGAPGPAADTSELERILAETEAARDAALAGTAANPLESCAVCHGDGSVYDAANYHVLTTNVEFELADQPAVVDGAVVINVDLKLNGAPVSGYTAVNRAVISRYDPLDRAFERYAFDRQGTAYTVASAEGAPGAYTVTITQIGGTGINPTTLVGEDVRYYLRLAGTGLPNASVSFGADEFTRDDLVSDQSCINCHGENGGDGLFGHHTMPWQAQACTTCHSVDNPVGFGDSRSSLATLAHGIHAGYALTGAAFEYRTDSWKTTYPTYMNNCSVCHDSTASLDAVNAAPVTLDFCLSCHGSMDNFKFERASAAPFRAFHLTITTDNCLDCHISGSAASRVTTVAEAHNNNSRTGRDGLIWNGQDLAVVEGAKVDMEITGVSYNGANLQVNWTTSYDGATVNPCNTTVGASAPIFIGATANTATGQAASNMSILRAYAQGDDWVNAGLNTHPGQAPATNLNAANTVCASNVATSTIPLTPEELATSATKGVVALQGRPQVQLGFDFNTAQPGVQNVIQVRSMTPTYEYVIGTGAAAAPRRDIVDSQKCLDCHVGSLYQHGGNRIDNVNMCVMCHNEASNEKNRRLDDGVDASEAYDGKVGQTFGFKSLLHAIHSSNSSNQGRNINEKLTMVYRTFGVYVWGTAGQDIPNWPGTGPQIVYGSNDVTRNHNFHAPTYPRNLKDCLACHAPGTFDVPDQAITVATTVDPGAEPWGNQLDDVLISTSTAACTSCHQNSSTVGHAYQNSFGPAIFPAGRQTILDAAN